MTALADITELLRRMESPGTFATRFNAAASALSIRVDGVGKLRLPITVATARNLIAHSAPACYGYQEETRLDARVRDTAEIARTRIDIDEARWRGPLAAHLTRIRRSLGLPAGAVLRAEVHSLLVYGPGQHFKPHRDSEKSDRMIGTLVVNLPSSFSGGSIEIRHGEQVLRVAGSARELTLIAFYADCVHEVLPVKKGYRVVLTFNLILDAKRGAEAARVPAKHALRNSIQRFFASPPPLRWKGDDQRPLPDRLVYLLDHQYTRQSLRWDLLKSADAKRADALRQAGLELDCEMALALADVHETWACEDAYDGRGRRWYAYDDDEEEEEEEDDGRGGPSDYELTDLIDSDVELRHWVGSDGAVGKIATSIAASELCFTIPSNEFEPFESEHEGFTGNAGNTVEHWYHRAAIVLWPRQRDFEIRAKAAPRWAIRQVARALEDDRRAAALDMARRLLPFWKAVSWQATSPALCGTTLKAAARLDDPALAAALLDPFAITLVEARAASSMLALLAAYGLPWWRKLLRAWAAARHDHYDPAQAPWVRDELPEICRALCVVPLHQGSALAQVMADRSWEWLESQIRLATDLRLPSERERELRSLAGPFLGIVRACSHAGGDDLSRQAIQLLANDNRFWSLSIEVLRAAHSRKAGREDPRLRLNLLHAHCTAMLNEWLDQPVRAADDWSVRDPVPGSGPLHAAFVQFLRASRQIRKEWPLAKQSRREIHRFIDEGGLPLTHVTRHTGRPFTLVLEKTAKLFEREATQRKSWIKTLQWLRETEAEFRS